MVSGVPHHVDGRMIGRATFEIPGATYVAHAFCSVCGSGLPRFDVAHGIAIVPIGSFEESV